MASFFLFDNGFEIVKARPINELEVSSVPVYARMSSGEFLIYMPDNTDLFIQAKSNQGANPNFNFSIYDLPFLESKDLLPRTKLNQLISGRKETCYFTERPEEQPFMLIAGGGLQRYGSTWRDSCGYFLVSNLPTGNIQNVANKLRLSTQ